MILVYGALQIQPAFEGNSLGKKAIRVTQDVSRRRSSFDRVLPCLRPHRMLWRCLVSRLTYTSPTLYNRPIAHSHRCSSSAALMRDTTKQLADLRALLKRENVDAYVVDSGDNHASEYVSEADKRRVSGCCYPAALKRADCCVWGRRAGVAFRLHGICW